MTSKDIEKSKIQSILEWYEGNRIIRALVQLLQVPLGPISIGFGGSIDVALVRTLENIRSERAKAFFDELAKDDSLIDESVLQSEDFLHCFFSTAKYALNARRREKIQMFARLLKSSVTKEGPNGVDEYEDFLGILDELSYRELQALDILDELSDKFKDMDQNDSEIKKIFYDEVNNRLIAELKIPANEITNFMNRISRTGCCDPFIGEYLACSHGEGKLTPIYKRFKKFISESSKVK